jgi:hypothetical protein
MGLRSRARKHFREANIRALDRYVDTYGRLPNDPLMVIGMLDSDEYVVDLLRRANNGEPHPMQDESV